MNTTVTVRGLADSLDDGDVSYFVEFVPMRSRP